MNFAAAAVIQHAGASTYAHLSITTAPPPPPADLDLSTNYEEVERYSSKRPYDFTEDEDDDEENHHSHHDATPAPTSRMTQKRESHGFFLYERNWSAIVYHGDRDGRALSV